MFKSIPKKKAIKSFKYYLIFFYNKLLKIIIYLFSKYTHKKFIKKKPYF